MKRSSSLLALFMLAGCAQPATQIAPTTVGAAPSAPQGDMVPATAPMSNGYHVSGAEEATDETTLVVRYKAGHEMQAMSKGRVKRQLHLERTQVIVTDNAGDREALLAELKLNPNVEFAEPDYRMKAFYTPNDANYSRLWGMTKIAMPAAWDTHKGASTIKVAVIDTGVDYNHPDLAGQVIKGKDFANNDADPMDDQGHGTHVSGTIAALMGNSTGVAGVAPGCKILAIKVLGGDGSGSTSGIADGITYAVQQGAQVINMSLGGPQQSSVLKAAVDGAIAKGVVVVVASGNDNASTANYPAAYPGVISVGSSGTSDTRDNYSNYNSTIALSAPGSNIYSTTKGGSYGNMSGTSMASPHVAGAAALLRSLHPTWTIAQVRTALVSTGDTVSGFSSGVKRMNVAKALAYGGGTAPAPTPAPGTSPAPTPAPTTGDKTGPVISGLKGSVGTTGATFYWTTDEAADGQLEIGTTTNPTSRTTHMPSLVANHKATLSNLVRNKQYYFRVRSRDKAGNLTVSKVYSFKTRAY